MSHSVRDPLQVVHRLFERGEVRNALFAARSLPSDGLDWKTVFYPDDFLNLSSQTGSVDRNMWNSCRAA